MAHHHRRLLFLVDFDETLTQTGKDTISRLAAAAYSAQRSQQLPPWSHFVDSYVRDHDQHTRARPPETRGTIAAEQEFLRSLRAVERASILRVEESGVFKGLDLPLFLRAAVGDRQRLGELMREGWWEATRKVLARGDGGAGGKVAVVSVNWSRAWIRECLEGSAQPGEDEVRRIEVYANELVVGDDGRTTTGFMDRWFGQEDGGIWTGWDKLRVMKDMIVRENEKSAAGTAALVVYVGDSTTDLLCLLEADVGIIFGTKLDAVCERLGIGIKNGLVTGMASGKELIRIEGWKEVEQWIDTV